MRLLLLSILCVTGCGSSTPSAPDPRAEMLRTQIANRETQPAVKSLPVEPEPVKTPRPHVLESLKEIASTLANAMPDVIVAPVPEPEPQSPPQNVTPPKPPGPFDHLEVVCYTADWCTSCKKWKRDVYPGLKAKGVRVRFVNYDEHKAEANALGVTGLPTYTILVSGKRVGRLLIGPQPAADLLAKLRAIPRPPERPSVGSQIVNELYRVTGTERPVGGLDVDLSDKTGDAASILAAMTSGRFEPTAGVLVEAKAGLFPTRIATTPTGPTVLHFDQRPLVTAKKFILKFRGRLERVELSRDGHKATVVLSGLPDVELKL